MEVNEAKEFLKSKGYYVDNLWHIEDVKDIRPNNLTDKQAYDKIFDVIKTNKTK